MSEEDSMPEKNDWKCIDQAFIGNIGIEVLNLGEENKKFISLTKFERKKNVIFPIEDAEMIADKIKKFVEEY